jgi:hypothetical protein
MISFYEDRLQFGPRYLCDWTLAYSGDRGCFSQVVDKPRDDPRYAIPVVSVIAFSRAKRGLPLEPKEVIEECLVTRASPELIDPELIAILAARMDTQLRLAKFIEAQADRGFTIISLEQYLPLLARI